MRQRVTLTEGQLRQIVEDASRMVIQEMIDEGWWDNFKNGATNAWNGFTNNVNNGVQALGNMGQTAYNNMRRNLSGSPAQIAGRLFNNATRAASNIAQTASNFNLPMAAYNAYNAYRPNNAAPNAANGGQYPTGSYPNAERAVRNAYITAGTLGAAPNAANGGMMPPMGGGYPPNAQGGGNRWTAAYNYMKNHPEQFMGRKSLQNTQSR
jgi:hypothetical protein